MTGRGRTLSVVKGRFFLMNGKLRITLREMIPNLTTAHIFSNGLMMMMMMLMMMMMMMSMMLLLLLLQPPC